MRKKIFLQLVLVSISHFLLCILSGASGWQLQTFIVSSASILALYISRIKLKASLWASVAVMAPFYLLYSIASSLSGDPATYPIWIYGLFVSLVTVWLLQWKVKPGISIILLVMLVFIGGMLVWPNNFARLHTEPHPENYQPFRSALVNVKEEPLDTAALRGKVVLFDIWHSACLNCIKQFPEIQALHDEYKNDSMVKIISLNFPLAKDKSTRPSKFTDQYSFEKAYFKSEDEYARFSARELPLVLIMDKDMNCRYAGLLNTGWNIFTGNAKRIINRLKNEK